MLQREIKVTARNAHNYLSVILDYSKPPYVTINQEEKGWEKIGKEKRGGDGPRYHHPG